MDEKDVLKIVKWWVESQLKVKKAFRESLFNALERYSYYEKEDSNAAALYDYGYSAHFVDCRVAEFWHKVLPLLVFNLLLLLLFVSIFKHQPPFEPHVLVGPKSRKPIKKNIHQLLFRIKLGC